MHEPQNRMPKQLKTVIASQRNERRSREPAFCDALEEVGQGPSQIAEHRSPGPLGRELTLSLLYVEPRIKFNAAHLLSITGGIRRATSSRIGGHLNIHLLRAPDQTPAGSPRGCLRQHCRPSA